MKWISGGVVLMLLAVLSFGQGLPDIPIPDDFYDGGARKAQVDALAASSVGAPGVTAVAAGVTNTVTLQAKGQGGANLAQRRVLRVWVGDAANGVPATNNVESVTMSGGAALQTVTANTHYVYLTGATGAATAVVVGEAAGTNYLMVADGGYVTSAAIVFTE
jgi:hypothetical protein